MSTVICTIIAEIVNTSCYYMYFEKMAVQVNVTQTVVIFYTTLFIWMSIIVLLT